MITDEFKYACRNIVSSLTHFERCLLLCTLSNDAAYNYEDRSYTCISLRQRLKELGHLEGYQFTTHTLIWLDDLNKEELNFLGRNISSWVFRVSLETTYQNLGVYCHSL